MKKIHKKVVMRLMCVMFIFTIALNINFNASTTTDDTECSSIYVELEDDGVDTTDMTCAEAKLEYRYSNSDTKSFSKNIASGFLSNDPEVREEEKNEYYYKYFLESNLVPFASQIDDSLFAMDSISNIVTTVITLFTNLVGMLNFITTTIIMFLLSVWQNGIITNIIDQLLVFINENILNIDSTTGSGMILIGSFALVLFIRNCFIYFKNGRPPVEYLKTFLVTLILIGLIPMSYTQIRPIMLNISDDISTAITSTIFGENDKSIEIELKEQVFDAMTFNGFMYKNFGVVTQEDLEQRDNIASDEAEVRIEGVLNSDETQMKEELDTYDSKFLSIDITSSISQLVTSLIWTIHSAINMILLAIPLLLLIILENVEQITWFFIWVPMVMLVFKMEEGYISSFLINRFQFLIGFTIINFVLITLLKSQLLITDLIMGYNIGFLLVVDIIMAIGFYLLWSVRETILAILRDLFKKVPDIAWGRTSTGEITSEFKPKLVKLNKLLGESMKIKKLEAESDDLKNQNKIDNTDSYEEAAEEHEVDNDSCIFDEETETTKDEDDTEEQEESEDSDVDEVELSEENLDLEDTDFDDIDLELGNPDDENLYDEDDIDLVSEDIELENNNNDEEADLYLEDIELENDNNDEEVDLYLANNDKPDNEVNLDLDDSDNNDEERLEDPKEDNTEENVDSNEGKETYENNDTEEDPNNYQSIIEEYFSKEDLEEAREEEN